MTDQPAPPTTSFHILTSNGPPEGLFPLLLKQLYGKRYEFHFEVFTTEEQLLHLLPVRNWGGIIAYLGNVRWNIPRDDDIGRRIQRVLRRHKELHPERLLLPRKIRELNVKGLLGNIQNGVQALSRIHRDHGIATIATQGLDLEDEFRDSGILFFSSPMTLDQCKQAAAYLLQIEQPLS